MNLALGEFDPSDSDAMRSAPGDFIAVDEEGELQQLGSYGMHNDVIAKSK